MMQLTKDQQKLILQNIKLVKRYISDSLKNNVVPKYLEEEFVSEILHKFCISALKFDYKSGFKFSTFAHHGFRFGLKSVMGTQQNELKRIRSFKDVSEFILEHKEDPLLEIDLLDNVVSKTNLNKRDIKIVKDYYYDGLSLRATGKSNGMSGEAVRLILNKFLRKIKIIVNSNKLEFKDFYK